MDEHSRRRKRAVGGARTGHRGPCRMRKIWLQVFNLSEVGNMVLFVLVLVWRWSAERFWVFFF